MLNYCKDAFTGTKLNAFHRKINYFLSISFDTGSRVSSGSIVSDYGLDERAIGVRSPAGAKDFSCSLCVQTGSGAHPASCTMGTGVLSPGVKARPGRDADHSPPSSAEVENEYTPLPQSASMACSGTALTFSFDTSHIEKCLK
jgi:hypothetical protein